MFRRGDTFGKSHFDRLPAVGEVRVARRQGPDRVRVVGEHDPGVDLERHEVAHATDGGPQQVDVGDQEVGAAVAQVDREEGGAAGYAGFAGSRALGGTLRLVVVA